MGIGETLRRALVKLVMRAAGYQEKKICGNLQLCSGLEAVIEGATHSVGQRILEKPRQRRRDVREFATSKQTNDRSQIEFATSKQANDRTLL